MSGINRAHDARVSRRGARRTHGPRDRKPPRDKPGPTRRKADSSSLEHVSRLTKMLAAVFFPRGNERIVARGRAFPLQLAPPKKPNEHAFVWKKGHVHRTVSTGFRSFIFPLCEFYYFFYFLLRIFAFETAASRCDQARLASTGRAIFTLSADLDSRQTKAIQFGFK